MNIRSEEGFSYIDVMIAIVILMVGILALMAGMSASILQAKGQEQQMVAKQNAAESKCFRRCFLVRVPCSTLERWNT